jgi:hypothetical protein
VDVWGGAPIPGLAASMLSIPPLLVANLKCLDIRPCASRLVGSPVGEWRERRYATNWEQTAGHNVFKNTGEA